MKPTLIAAMSAMFVAPLAPLRRPPVPPLPVAKPAAAQAADLAASVWLAREDAGNALKGASFHFAAPSRPVKVASDPAALRSGLAALMSASAASMRGRKHPGLALKVATAGGRVTLVLRDAGPGLSVAELTEMYGGRTSRLAAARRRLESAGGVVNVDTELGAGTVYTIELKTAG